MIFNEEVYKLGEENMLERETLLLHSGVRVK